MDQYWGADEADPQMPAFARPAPLVSSAVLGTVLFIIAELMLFAGMISGFMIVKTQSIGAWPPPGQPRLPLIGTAFNTAALLASGVLMYQAFRAYQVDRASARTPFLCSMALGAFFVLFQGYEWVQLIGEGLTLTSSNHGAFFYLIVGTHALHAFVALLVLVQAYRLLARDALGPSRFQATALFWYFVVGLWPVLYWQVYL